MDDYNVKTFYNLIKQLPSEYQFKCLEQMISVLEPRIYQKSDVTRTINKACGGLTMNNYLELMDEFTSLEERNSKLVLENKKLRDEINILRGEKESMYRELLCMKNEILNHYDNIGKAYFADKFYEE